MASSPSISGIRMSIRTTSGRVRRTASMASAPLVASADHLDAVGGQDHPEAGADQRLVVGDDDAQRRGHWAANGICAVTR